jgi:hypothetical protein
MGFVQSKWAHYRKGRRMTKEEGIVKKEEKEMEKEEEKERKKKFSLVPVQIESGQ